MVYQWAQHKDVCFKLYIEERRSLEEIMQHMRDVYSFNPSKRAFQQQFRRWGFPSKQNPAHRNADLVERVRQLWEMNKSQKEMLDILNQEGYQLKERELMRLRAKNRWLLRIPNGLKKQGMATDDLGSFPEEQFDTTGAPTDGNTQDVSMMSERTKEGLDDILRRRQEMQAQRQAESNEKWMSKKRRRRTKGYAGLPADPPGPPRFPSETTLEEGKQYLGLTNKQYRDTRDQFQTICEEEGVIKKTLAGAEKWQEIKDRLVRENIALQSAFFGTDKAELQTKELSLDVICTDVTKRIRSIGRRMTIAQAKNVLGINPEQSRQIRNAFYTTLQEDKFTSKLETGTEHWQELKEQWVAQNDILQQVFALGNQDPQFGEKEKALEALCRDVMKRLRDDQAKQRRGTGGSYDGDDTTMHQDETSLSATASRAAGIASQQNGQASSGYQFAAQELSDMQIDPSLLEAAGTFAVQQVPIPVYIRPHAKSEIHVADKMWLASLSSPSVQQLYQVIVSKWPDASIFRVYGIKKEQGGQEVSFLMEQDDELEAYLEHVKDHKAMFAVQLNRP